MYWVCFFLIQGFWNEKGLDCSSTSHLPLLRRPKSTHERLEYVCAAIVGEQHAKLHLHVPGSVRSGLVVSELAGWCGVVCAKSHELTVVAIKIFFFSCRVFRRRPGVVVTKRVPLSRLGATHARTEVFPSGPFAPSLLISSTSWFTSSSTLSVIFLVTSALRLCAFRRGNKGPFFNSIDIKTFV